MKKEQHPDGKWQTSRYYYKERLIIIKSKLNRGMKAHVFTDTSETKVDFTLRYSFIYPNDLLNKAKVRIDKLPPPQRRKDEHLLH